MPDLVLDANTALHAKQLSGSNTGIDPMGVLDLVFGRGVRVVITTKVLGEQNAMSLSRHHERWFAEGILRTQGGGGSRTKQLVNQLSRIRPRPNAEDIPLIELAQRLDGVLYSHDAAEILWARAARVTVVDVVELAGFTVHLGLAAAADIDLGHANLSTRKGIPKPEDWRGSVSSTLAHRPGVESLFARLDAWLDASPVE